MNQLYAGIVFILLGGALLLYSSRTSKKQQENTAFKAPYLKNAGIAFVLFGLYYLFRYFAS